MILEYTEKRKLISISGTNDNTNVVPNAEVQATEAPDIANETDDILKPNKTTVASKQHQKSQTINLYQLITQLYILMRMHHQKHKHKQNQKHN